jgi:hypothetical protein
MTGNVRQWKPASAPFEWHEIVRETLQRRGKPNSGVHNIRPDGERRPGDLVSFLGKIALVAGSSPRGRFIRMGKCGPNVVEREWLPTGCSSSFRRTGTPAILSV